MNKDTLAASLGGLLHDLGKLQYRRGGTHTDHSELGYELLSGMAGKAKEGGNADSFADALDCVRYHHAAKLRDARIPKGSPAYAVYIGDNIASGCDRREISDGNGPFNLSHPLTSVFGTMKGAPNSDAYKAAMFDINRVAYPRGFSGTSDSSADYAAIVTSLSHELASIEFNADYLNSLLAVTEACMSNVPSTTACGQVQDVSLFDHVKMTAACASCITEYCREKGRDNLRAVLFDGEKSFMKEKAFLMYSADVSGIQSFIYNIVSSNALKSLRSRSFSLELLLEHFIDELLDGAGLSRCNLIYSGGGHCYILLPNTDAAKRAAENCGGCMKRWLIDSFGVSLYLASAAVECSANDLVNLPAEEAPYSAVFRKLSREISAKKMRRYTADDIKRLNSTDRGGDNTRECKVCGRSDLLSGGDLCENCARFVEMGRVIIKPSLTIAVTRVKPAASFSWLLPSVDGERWLSFIEDDANGEKTRRLISRGADNIVRIYTKNRACTGLRFARSLYVGDYCMNSDLGGLYERAAKEGGSGIKRIAVARMDVDELGRAFISGFETPDPDPAIRYKYVTVSRAASFSRQMSLFFRGYINAILSGKGGVLYPENGERSEKRVNIVYSGGDDVFLVGLWRDVIESALLIRDAFTKYCAGALTISAGIGIFPIKHPISDAARATAELEDKAKAYISPDGAKKNAVALFTADDDFTFGWDELRDSVIGEKIGQIAKLLDYPKQNEESERRGKAMLYNLLELLRGADDKINIARYAYRLTLLEPKTRDELYKGIYREFSANMYKWILNKKDRRELVAAITIYAYTVRGEKK